MSVNRIEAERGADGRKVEVIPKNSRKIERDTGESSGAMVVLVTADCRMNVDVVEGRVELM